jgi:hypothetical protein
MWNALRRFIASALVFVGLLALPGGVLAGKPTKEVNPNPPDLVAGGCGFPVVVHFEGESIRIAFTDSIGDLAGFVEVYPATRAVLTNPAIGKQIVAVDPGPARLDLNPDSSASYVGTGPWLWTESSPATHEPGIWLIRGRFVFTFDAERNVTSFRLDGSATNICPRLAS